MMYITLQEHVITLNHEVKNLFLQPCKLNPNPPALLLLTRFIIQLSSNNPSFFFHCSLSYSACGQVLWHELSNPVLLHNKFSLYSQSFYGNLISSTLTALSSFLAGFFSSCSSSLWMCVPFFFFFLLFESAVIYSSAADEVARGNECINVECSALLCSAVKSLLTVS